MSKKNVRSGIRTHAHIRGPENSFEQGNLESGALDHSAILTTKKNCIKVTPFILLWF